jgi:hypothetical protein
MAKVRILGVLLLVAILLITWRVNRVQKEAAETTPTPSRITSSQSTGLKSPSRAETSTAANTKQGPGGTTEKLVLTPPDLEPLLAAARERDSRKLPFRFAAPLPINKSSALLAPWKVENEVATWSLEIHAPDALSLNFAFDQFHMPPGGSLSLTAPGSPDVISFTSRDNDDHGELWTPLFTGDTVRLTASVPQSLLSELRLSLAAVNYGFRNKTKSKIGGDTSGSCNVDVACDLNGIVDAYRDQIRSVGAYTLSGIDTCSGALINNTAEDTRPFFLTANHCGINSSNDASIVVYWNFENSTCRTPGSSNSGGVGDGDLTVFNSGSTLRANLASSDFCLIELDDPVNPDSEAFFAGWDRSSGAPNMAVGIHHPAVAEKRISFEFDPLSLTNYFGTSVTSSGTHLRVADWDNGTTEGGSSGSPLFNAEGQIVGQLHGGNAACGNNEDDWYGRVFRSWTGGNSNATRLSNWLAPGGSAPQSLEGIELDIQLRVEDVAVAEGDSGSQTVSITVELASETDEPVTFTLAPNGGTASAGTDYEDPGGQTFTISPPLTSATATFTVNGDMDPEENETVLFSFSNLSGATAPSTPVTVVITNDDFITPVITSNLSLNGDEGSLFGYQIEADNTPTTYELSGAPSGMVVDSASGFVSWQSPQGGVYSFTISAGNPAGTTESVVELTINLSPLKPAFEVPSSVGLGGDVASWSITTSNTFDGEDALELTDASNSTNTRLTLTVTGPDALTFWWKCSTEYLFDVFSLSLDGNVAFAISGETDWHSETVLIPAGEHSLEFSYQRDNGVDGGSNTVALDRFTLNSLSEPAFSKTSPIFVPNRQEVSIQLPTNYENSGITTDALPTDWELLSGGHLTGTVASSFSVTATAENAQGSTTREFQLTPFSPSRSLSTAVDFADLPLRTSTPAFFVQSSVRSNGTTAARSANIGDDDRSQMTASVVGPGTLRFQWRVSTEEGFDYAYTLLNGKQVAVSSGDNTSFTEVVVPLAYGLNEITWLYVKDETVDENLDAIFVDNIRLEGYAQWVFDNDSSPFALAPGSGIDGDINPSLLEYAVGLDPTIPEPPYLLEMSRNTGSLVLSTTLNPSARDITLSIEKSTSLLPGAWFTIASDAAPFATSLSEQDTSDDEKAFYRLHVTSP